MERYDYFDTLCKDIKIALATDYDREEGYDVLYEKMWVDDSITGNASGSYYCNAWKAEEAICHNLDLIEEVAEEYGIPDDWKKYSAEYWDVAIRCYLLGEALQKVLEAGSLSNTTYWERG